MASLASLGICKRGRLVNGLYENRKLDFQTWPNLLLKFPKSSIIALQILKVYSFKKLLSVYLVHCFCLV